jgi:diguanylate cyclase (GGDEF)-like protein
VDTLTEMLEAIQELSLARELSAVQGIVRRRARRLAHADGATFVLRDGDHCFYADEDAIAPLWKGQRFPIEACISGWAMLQRRPAVIPDIYADERVPHGAYRPTFVRSLVMVPIRSRMPIGAIGVYWARNHEPSEETTRVLQALADSTALAIESVSVHGQLDHVEEQLHDIRTLAETDELTGVLNRRGFRHVVERELAHAGRAPGARFLVYLDVDGMKQLNDSHGHAVGDDVLVRVARALRGCLGATDAVGRIGGDEFAVFCTSEGPADLVVERIQLEIARETAYLPCPVRVSAGAVHALDSVDYRALLAAADSRMYENKARPPV